MDVLFSTSAPSPGIVSVNGLGVVGPSIFAALGEPSFKRKGPQHHLPRGCLPPLPKFPERGVLAHYVNVDGRVRWLSLPDLHEITADSLAWMDLQVERKYGVGWRRRLSVLRD